MLGSEKYTLFFLALCTLCLTTTVIIYCHHADHNSREEIMDDVKLQVDGLRDRMADMMMLMRHGHHPHQREHHPHRLHVDRKRVYATLYHNPSCDAGYALGLRVLVHSVRRAGCRQPFVVMHLESHEQVLQCLGEEVMGQLVEEQDVSFRKVDPVEKVFPSEAFLHIAKHRWHVAINKVRAWEMIEYAKVLFIDVDSVVLKNLDFLFGYPELAASNDQAVIHRYDTLNPGFMVLQPNISTFATFIKFCGKLDETDRTMSTAEQGMLISLYPRPFILPNTFALTPAAASRLIDRDFKWRDVFSLHFYDTDTDIVPKPWTLHGPPHTSLNERLSTWDTAYAMWWAICQRLPATDRRSQLEDSDLGNVI